MSQTEEVNETEETINLEEQNEPEAVEGEDKSASTEGETPEDDGNEITVSIGEEDPHEEEEKQAPQWVKEVRKTNRELQREKREWEREKRELLARVEQASAETKPVLGKKPALEDDDIDFDPEKFEIALTQWHEQKRQVEKEAERIEAARKAEEDAWAARVAEYGRLKAEVKVKDFDEAEQDAVAILSDIQRGIIVQGCENPALVIYGLGKNHAEANALAAIKDPVKFAFAIAKMEATKLKVSERKPAPPPPERQIKGSGSTAGAVDSHLEKLEANAAKTGDRTEIIRYKAQLRNKTR